MTQSLRRLVAETNVRRAGLELQGAAAFRVVTQALVELRAPQSIVDLSSRAVADELRHSEIYLTLARAYSEKDLPALEPASLAVPEYPSVGANGERLLQVVGMCCINETMACSFLELCFAGACAPQVRGGIHQVLQDEIKHARVGWAHLGSGDMGESERRLVSTWLLPILRVQWAHWRAHIASLPRGDLVEHGCPSPAAIEEASLESMRALVLPGFARAGVDVVAARRWLEDGASSYRFTGWARSSRSGRSPIRTRAAHIRRCTYKPRYCPPPARRHRRTAGRCTGNPRRGRRWSRSSNRRDSLRRRRGSRRRVTAHQGTAPARRPDCSRMVWLPHGRRPYIVHAKIPDP
jgi:hypothetical protein